MSTNSEKSFGARLRNGNTLVTYTGTFANFSPPREEDKPEQMKVLLTGIEDMNKEVTKASEAYSEAVANRQDVFKNSDDSMTRLLSPILGAVEAQYGKKSVQYKLISAVIKKIRASRVEKAPANPDDPDAKEKIKNSTRSFGSLTQHFSDIITNLAQYPEYKPDNQKITVEGLTALLAKMKAGNDNVDLTFSKRSDLKAQRIALYDDFRERVGRVKAYAKSTYGNNSKEHKLIKGLVV